MTKDSEITEILVTTGSWLDKRQADPFGHNLLSEENACAGRRWLRGSLPVPPSKQTRQELM